MKKSLGIFQIDVKKVIDGLGDVTTTFGVFSSPDSLNYPELLNAIKSGKILIAKNGGVVGAGTYTGSISQYFGATPKLIYTDENNYTIECFAISTGSTRLSVGVAIIDGKIDHLCAIHDANITLLATY